MYGYIYKTTNIVNNKLYIGQHKHSRFDENYKGSGKILRDAILKYGWNNFNTELIEECDSKSLLDERERYWIDYYNARDKTVGYNISKGGEGNSRACSKETKLVISIANKISLNKPEVKAKLSKSATGRIYSIEARKKMSDSRKGKTFTDEHKQHLSKSLQRRMKDADVQKHLSEWQIGKSLSDETKRKISQSVSKSLKGNYFGYKSKQDFMNAHNGMTYSEYYHHRKENK